MKSSLQSLIPLLPFLLNHLRLSSLSILILVQQSSSLLPVTSQHGHSWHGAPLVPIAIYLFSVKTFVFFFFFRCSSFDKREGLGSFIIGVPLLHLIATLILAAQSSSLLPATSQHSHSWRQAPLGPMVACNPSYIASGQHQQKTQFSNNSSIVIEVFNLPLHRNSSSLIVACVFVVTRMFTKLLPSNKHLC
jgi:hypothetical protein